MKTTLRRFFLTFLMLGAHISFAQLSQTNLPIVIINTNGIPIADTQVLASFKIINNVSGINTPADAPQYSGNIGIDLRGSSVHPKRSYNVETWISYKLELDTSLLGMPSDNDWVLLSNYTDRSLMRDLIGFRIFEQMGNYAPRMKPCEVIVNNAYQGIYLFGENIKRDKNRVDIAKLRNIDVSGLELTGGYIFKIDASNKDFWTSSFSPPFATGNQDIRFHYEYPKDNAITNVQKAYIKSFTDSFENELNSTDFQDTLIGWRAHAGHKSFKDYLIFNEVIKSADAYRLATYLYKDKGKKLRAGPPWDLELSLFNTSDCNASKDTGFAYQYNIFCGNNNFLTPFWWSKLMTDTLFNRELKCRYQEFRSDVLNEAKIFQFIDSMSAYINAMGAVDRNFVQYPIFGVPLVNEPMPLSANHTEEVAKIKSFISRRLQYLDAQWQPAVCFTTNISTASKLLSGITLFPNPSDGDFQLQFSMRNSGKISLKVTDIFGREMLQKTLENLSGGIHSVSISASNFSAGIYILQIWDEGEMLGVKRMVKE